MTAAAAPTGLLAEQIWDVQPPAKLPPHPVAGGKAPKTPKFVAGTGTMSATPLAWSQAQFIRLAWSAAAGKPVETPLVVQCTFFKTCQ
jgi:glucoamylase